MKCFYHNDMDGRCAGALVRTLHHNTKIIDARMEQKKDYIEVDYTTPINSDIICPKETVYFVDYSFTEATKGLLLYLLNDLKCNVIWIDHHTSSINLCKIYPELNEIPGIRDERYSGAMLTWFWFKGTHLSDSLELNYDLAPYFVKLVDDYDCWKKELADSDFFKLGIDASKNNVFDVDSIWYELLADSTRVKDIIEIGKIIKKYIDEDNDYYRQSFSYDTLICGIPCLVVNKKTNSWVFGEEYYNYPIVMVWVFDGEWYTYSIFSNRKDIDCSKIAEYYGGGGHKGAAGFKSQTLLFKKEDISIQNML